MKNILIIGSHGFIGRKLTHYLSNQHHLYLVDIALFSSVKDELPRNATYIEGPLHEEMEAVHVLKKTEFHCAYYLASSSFPLSSWNDPMVEIKKNLNPFIAFQDLASKLKIKRIVFISSGGTIYGNQSGIITESAPPRPFSPYGIFKSCMENLLEYGFKKHGQQYDIYRVSNVYGPDQPLKAGFGVINTWLHKAFNDEPITIFGNGENTKDYIYIDDVIRLISLSAEQNTWEENGIFNVSSMQTISLLGLTELIREVTNKSLTIHFEPEKPGDNKFVVLDNNKIKKHCPDHCFLPLEEGLKKMYEIIQTNVPIA